MEVDVVSKFITTVGFPISICVFLLWYIAKYINKKDEQNREDTNRQIQEMKVENKETLRIVMEKNKEREIEGRNREEKLQGIIFKNQEIISDLAIKFDVVQEVKENVDEIKIILKNKK